MNNKNRALCILSSSLQSISCSVQHAARGILLVTENIPNDTLLSVIYALKSEPRIEIYIKLEQLLPTTERMIGGTFPLGT